MAILKPLPSVEYCLMALMRLRASVSKPRVARQQQVGVGLVLVAAHAAAQLVKFAQAETIGAIDDDRVGVREYRGRFR